MSSYSKKKKKDEFSYNQTKSSYKNCGAIKLQQQLYRSVRLQQVGRADGYRAAPVPNLNEMEMSFSNLRLIYEATPHV